MQLVVEPGLRVRAGRERQRLVVAGDALQPRVDRRVRRIQQLDLGHLGDRIPQQRPGIHPVRRGAADAQRRAAAGRHRAHVVDARNHEDDVAGLGDPDHLVGARIFLVALVDDEPERGRERIDRVRVVAVARALLAGQRDAVVRAVLRVDALERELARRREQCP